MTASSHTELDAILILDALKSIVEAKLPADSLPVEPEDVSEYLTDIARIVQRSANISEEQLSAGRAYGGEEWLHAILRSIYGPARALAILRSGKL